MYVQFRGAQPLKFDVDIQNYYILKGVAFSKSRFFRVSMTIYVQFLGCSLYTIWSNYSDLTRPHPKWWFIKGNPLISGKSRLVKYYNLPRYNGGSSNSWITSHLHSGASWHGLPWVKLVGLGVERVTLGFPWEA